MNIPDDTYESMSSLSELYGQGISQTILDILKVINDDGGWMRQLQKDHKAPVELKRVLAQYLGAALYSTGFFNEILEKLQVKGLFTLQDYEFDLEQNTFTFNYATSGGSNFFMDQFFLTLESGLKSLRIYKLIEVAKVTEKSLEKLEQLAEEFEAPTEFNDLEECSVIVEADPDYWNVIINCEAESFEYFPKMKQLSRVMQRLLKNAGIQSKIEC